MKKIGNTFIEFLKECPSESFKKKLEDYYNSMKEEAPDLNEFGKDLLSDFGGFFYLVESEEDFKAIETPHWNSNLNRYFRLDEMPASFDICEKLEDGFVHMLLCTNNAGGNTYLIPPKLATHQTIQTSILMTANANN